MVPRKKRPLKERLEIIKVKRPRFRIGQTVIILLAKDHMGPYYTKGSFLGWDERRRFYKVKVDDRTLYLSSLEFGPLI